LAAGVVISFLIPNDVFRIYGWIALAGAAIFVMIQLVFLVDFVHRVAERFVSKYQEAQEKSWYVVLSTRLVVISNIIFTSEIDYTDKQSVLQHALFVSVIYLTCEDYIGDSITNFSGPLDYVFQLYLPFVGMLCYWDSLAFVTLEFL
jgi:hypothetical protein